MEGRGLLRRKLRAARRLSAGDWLLIGRAWLLLVLADSALRLLSLARVQRLMPRAAAGPRRSVESVAATIRRLHGLVDAAARNHLYPMTCLPKALVLHRLLAQRGIATRLEIGVQKAGAALAAHAWLTYEDRPIGQPDDIRSRYVPLVTVERTRCSGQAHGSARPT
jgi:hypothetical protein